MVVVVVLEQPEDRRRPCTCTANEQNEQNAKLI